MPARPEGVYPDGRGGWYFKYSLGRDPLTGRRAQVPRRGFRTAAEAGAGHHIGGHQRRHRGVQGPIRTRRIACLDSDPVAVCC